MANTSLPSKVVDWRELCLVCRSQSSLSAVQGNRQAIKYMEVLSGKPGLSTH